MCLHCHPQQSAHQYNRPMNDNASLFPLVGTILNVNGTETAQGVSKSNPGEARCVGAICRQPRTVLK